MVLWGYDHNGAYACVGLDTIHFEKPWDVEQGMIFTEFWTDNMGEKIASLFTDTANMPNQEIINIMPRLIKFE